LPTGWSIWKVSIEGGEPVQLASQNTYSAAYSPDGKWIACIYNPDPLKPAMIGLLPASGGAFSKTLPFPVVSVDPDSRISWAPDGRSINYLDAREGVPNIWSLPLHGGAPRQLTDFKTDMTYNFAWSSDGQKLVLSRGIDTFDVVMITNFR